MRLLHSDFSGGWNVDAKKLFSPLSVNHAAGEEELITWAEFVAVFVPLGPMKSAKETATETTEVESWRAGVNDEELELLRVAFATVDHGCNGRVSLAELRAVCAELDEEEPPEAALGNAMGVRSVRNQGFRIACEGCTLSYILYLNLLHACRIPRKALFPLCLSR